MSASRTGQSPTSTSDTPPLIDWPQALANMPGGMKSAGSLAQMFLKECPKCLEQIRTGLEANDVETVRRLSHMMKSSAAIFAAQPMVELATRIENLAKTGTLTGIPPMFQELDLMGQRIVVELQQFLEQQ